VIRLVRVTNSAVAFHDFEDYERLASAAKEIDDRACLVALLGGEAGLRLGEMAALRWADVDLAKRQLCVQRTVWKGHVTAPKGGRLRYVPLTARLGAALSAHRHLRGPLVLCGDSGRVLTEHEIQALMRRTARWAGLQHDGVHVLRHTFCSHLAMKGAPARAIQELAGHKDLSTTQRYMHLSPAALDRAIRLLDPPGCGQFRGDILETAAPSERKVNG
jgi:integrase